MKDIGDEILEWICGDCWAMHGCNGCGSHLVYLMGYMVMMQCIVKVLLGGS